MNQLKMIQMFQQVMKSPDKISTLKSLIGNNTQAMNMLSQIENMTPEQRMEALNKQCNQLGISQEQLMKFLGYK